METNNATLFGKMAAVMGSVRTLEKTGRNTYDKYDYVTADAIAIAIGREMAKQKLVLIPSVTSVDTTEYTTAKGGTNFRTVVHMDMTLACGDTGATCAAAWVGEAIDRSDKSISKAIVSATKYFLLKTFLLAGGDDDADAETPEVAVRAATSQHTANGAKTQQRAPESPTEAMAQAAQADDNPFEDVSPYGRKLIASWAGPQDAYAWAIQEGACANEYEARNSLKKIIDARFGGKLTQQNMNAALTAFYLRQDEKLAALVDDTEAEAAQAELAAA